MSIRHRHRHRHMSWFGASIAVLVLLSSPKAYASPWTLPQHDLVISSDFSFSQASREYLDSGRRQLYSVGGELQTSNLALSLRYGFTDRFEMEIRPNFKQLSYESDAVILNTGEVMSIEDARGRLVDFDNSIIGASDMDLAGRYNLLKSSYLMVTFEGGAKIPLGYTQPTSTFAELDPANNVFVLGDDATLGDGQIDVRGGLLLGSYLPLTRTFARVDGAFNHRVGAPGDQVLVNGKLGQFITDNIIIVGGVRWAKTVIRGTPIGTTAIDLAPEQGADNFDISKVDLDAPLYLDRDYTIVEVGLIAHFEKVELRIGVEDVVDGRNFADLRTLNFGITTSFPGATRPESQEPDVVIPASTQDGEQDTEIIEEVIIVPVEEGASSGESSNNTEVVEEVIIEVVEPEEDREESEVPVEPETSPSTPNSP